MRYLLLIVPVINAAPALGGVSTQSFERTVTRTVKLNYAVFTPASYDSQPDKRCPVILFLHGAGERGDDLSKVTGQPIFSYAQKTRDFPFIIIAPQCPLMRQWKPDDLIALLDEVESKYRIDPDRVYLTGYSMGGTGTWALAMDYPQRFAAIAPLCGRAIPVLVGNIYKTPVWVFHGEKDEVVPVEQSRQMVEFLKGLDNKEVKFTAYPDEGHAIWDRVYNDPSLYEWFLKHRRILPASNNAASADD